MYKCNYCGRHLKQKHNNCPACGSNSFEKINNIGQYVIKTPPKDGYIVNLKNYKMQKKHGRAGIYFGIFILLFVLDPFMLLMSFDSDGKFDWLSPFTFFFFITLIAVCSMIFEFFKKSKEIINPAQKSIKKVKELSKKGILIKNLTYRLKPVDKRMKGPQTSYKIQVIYEVEKGKTMNFESEPKLLTALGRDDGTVDLLLDPDDYSNYFIDFEIY